MSGPMTAVGGISFDVKQWTSLDNLFVRPGEGLQVQLGV